MKRIAAVVMIVGLSGVGLSPAVAGKPVDTPGPKAGKASKAKAYGKYCRGQSKKHLKGQNGTPFSQCVNAMAKVARKDKAPKRACKELSKKHVKGEKGTAYSRCVVAAAKLKKNEKEKAPEEETPVS
jgi:hypothetical protein